MHIMQVLDHQAMVDAVKGFGDINEPKDHSMGDRLVNSCVDEVKEENKVKSHDNNTIFSKLYSAGAYTTVSCLFPFLFFSVVYVSHRRNALIKKLI